MLHNQWLRVVNFVHGNAKCEIIFGQRNYIPHLIQPVNLYEHGATLLQSFGQDQVYETYNVMQI